MNDKNFHRDLLLKEWFTYLEFHFDRSILHAMRSVCRHICVIVVPMGVSRPFLILFWRNNSFETLKNFHCRPFLLFLFICCPCDKTANILLHLTQSRSISNGNYDTHRGFNTVSGIIYFSLELTVSPSDESFVRSGALEIKFFLYWTCSIEFNARKLIDFSYQ